MTMDADTSGNPIAEKRRQRKLENQRLEAEARKRQEDLRLQKERERKRQEDERIAAERRRQEETDQLKCRREAELARIAGLERAEREQIQHVESKLKLIGAFCTREIDLSVGALPLCCAVLSPASLEKPITGLDENVAFVGDAECFISVYQLRDGKCLFKILVEYNSGGGGVGSSRGGEGGGAIGNGPLASVDLGIVGVYDVQQLISMYQPSISRSAAVPVLKGSSALVAAYAFPSTTAKGGAIPRSRIRSVCVDDTASELFVSDHSRHCIHALALNPTVYQRESQAFVTRSKPPVSLSRSFGSKGHGRGQLHSPAGLDVSHYHVLVCDRGNNRVVAFSKRGAFVCSFGSKGGNPGQFMDPRDVKLANVRKRAISRGVSSDESSISSEQFDMIVADLGNFRVRVLNESGESIRVLSLLSGVDQIRFHQELIGASYARLLQYYASIGQLLPSLAGSGLLSLFKLAEHVHPSDSLYQNITREVEAIRHDSARFHHPRSISYLAKEREVLVLDRQNVRLSVYNVEGSRSVWTGFPRAKQQTEAAAGKGVSSVHSSLVLGDRMFVSDPVAHRIAVLRFPSLEFIAFMGATSYGDHMLCSEGYLPGELRSPSNMAVYQDGQGQPCLLVSDTGNHYISVFDPITCEFRSRIGAGFGHLDSYLDSPQGLAVYEHRWLYVCDQRNHRVQVFDLTTRTFSKSIGHDQGSAPREFSFPVAVAVCGPLPRVAKCDFGPYRDAKYCVGDAGNYRIQVLAVDDDSVLYIVDARHTPFELPIVPSVIVFDARSSYFLVADMNNRSVAVFRHDGTFVSAFGNNLEPENCFQRPSGLVLAAQQHPVLVERVLITDAVRMAICSFELRGE